MDEGIEDGRTSSKSPHYKFGYFLSMSQQVVSADIITNSFVGLFSPKTEREQRYKQLGYTYKMVTTQI
jgi:hypothetical protein